MPTHSRSRQFLLQALTRTVVTASLTIVDVHTLHWLCALGGGSLPLDVPVCPALTRLPQTAMSPLASGGYGSSSFRPLSAPLSGL